MIEAQRCGEQCLEADGAVGGFGEGVALHVGVLRVVARHDHVDLAGGKALHHGAAIVLAAQRRPQAQEGAVGADVVLVEGEVIDGDAARHRQLALLGGADHGQALGARQRGGVIAPAGDLDQAHVALQHDGLGRLVHAGQAQSRRHLAGVHDAALGEVRVLRVVDDERGVVLGVEQHVAHHARVGDARSCRW